MLNVAENKLIASSQVHTSWISVMNSAASWLNLVTFKIQKFYFINSSAWRHLISVQNFMSSCVTLILANDS
jgi:hypothetical protein